MHTSTSSVALSTVEGSKGVSDAYDREARVIGIATRRRETAKTDRDIMREELATDIVEIGVVYSYDRANDDSIT